MLILYSQVIAPTTLTDSPTQTRTDQSPLDSLSLEILHFPYYLNFVTLQMTGSKMSVATTPIFFTILDFEMILKNLSIKMKCLKKFSTAFFEA